MQLLKLTNQKPARRILRAGFWLARAPSCLVGSTSGASKLSRLEIEPSLKGHSQLMHMRIKYNFLADLHVIRRA